MLPIRFFLEIFQRLREVDGGKALKEDKEKSKEKGSGDKTPFVEPPPLPTTPTPLPGSPTKSLKTHLVERPTKYRRVFNLRPRKGARSLVYHQTSSLHCIEYHCIEHIRQHECIFSQLIVITIIIMVVTTLPLLLSSFFPFSSPTVDQPSSVRSTSTITNSSTNSIITPNMRSSCSFLAC